MVIRSAKFVCSSPDVDSCPPPVFPEYVFCGRSNVGKSSLINMIAGTSGLAKTSSTPGKTKLINHFLINDAWYITDLPGYGYARISKTEQAGWKSMIESYFKKRENLMCLFVLIDSRLEAQKNDLEFIRWLGENSIPFVIAFTKTDKLTRNNLQQNIAAYKKTLLNFWEILPEIFLTSSDTSLGKKEMLSFIENSNKIFRKPI